MLSDAELELIPEGIRTKVVEWKKLTTLKIAHLEERLRQELREKYGPASEKLNDSQLALLNLEPGVHQAEVQLEADLSAQEKLAAAEFRSKPRPKRGALSLPADLPREEVIIGCEPADCVCPKCKQERKVIGYDTSERLHCIPARYFVKVYKMEKRACPACKTGAKTAARPPFIISKGIASNEVVVNFAIDKYELHVPLYRNRLHLDRMTGIYLPESTACDWMMQIGFLLQAVVRKLMAELVAGEYIQADETPIGVRSKEVKGRNHQGYLWEYSRPGGPVVFDYRDGRSRAGPLEKLKDFRGVLQIDGYQAYNKVGAEGMIHAGCMAHVRRQFQKAAMLCPTDPRPLQILDTIRELYAVEREAKERRLSCPERAALRGEKSASIMTRLKAELIALREESLKGLCVADACDYALNQWERLEVFLSNGQVEIDNNFCEQNIRPVALGRKNWLHFGSKEAGPRIAAIISIVETCHRHGINVREYLLEVLPKLATGKHSEVASLTPMAWKAAREAAATATQGN